MQTVPAPFSRGSVQMVAGTEPRAIASGGTNDTLELCVTEKRK